MSGLRRQLQEYLVIRRAMGFKMERHAKLLAQFIDHLDTHDAATLTIEHALAWASAPSTADQRWWAARLSMVRGFAVYLHAIDPVHEVPPRGLMTGGSGRNIVPYLYTDPEIAALVRAAGELSGQLPAATYQTAIRLDREDLDGDLGLLNVHDTKFGKSRQVPLHPTTITGLRDYLALCDQLQPQPRTAALLLSTLGFRLHYQRLWETFHRLVAQAGLKPRSPRCTPRIHDLRHTFAVTTLLDWYRDGADVAAMLPHLSTYLGHTDPKHTYWYLSAAPELLALASDRLEAHQEALR